MQVIYTAAHGVSGGHAVPLGGGAAISQQLMHEWERTQPFPVTLLGPAVLGRAAPSGADLVRFSEWEYAAFCHAFRRAATAEILRHDPAETVVLVNDISEGPDFGALARAGFRVHTIYHVDVVAYVTSMYLGGRVTPESAVAWWERLRRWMPLPKIASLVFDQQRDSLEFSRSVIVPSLGMKAILTRCYPRFAARVRVLPWGTWAEDPEETELAADRARIRAEYGVPEGAPVLMTLSRISPEKGQDLLLEALADLEREGLRGAWVFVCGEAAYMQGVRFDRRLRRLANRLRHTRVVFPGYTAGLRKQAFFSLADLYVFPSRHESYGLTLVEALHAGLPAVCLDHSGAREVMRPEFGAIVPAGPRAQVVRGLREAVLRLMSDAQGRRRMGESARAWARTQRFSDRAAELARWLSAADR